MKTLFVVLSVTLLAVATPARSSVFQNFVTLDFPAADPIDATTVENFGTINVSGTSVLFDTQNTLHFINKSSGTINAFPGARFGFVQGYTRLPLMGFTNQGRIFVSENLLVSATNLVVSGSGLLSATRSGRVRLEGQNVNLTGGRVRAGNASDQFNGSDGNLTFPSQRLYVNPGNVVDEYWGVTNTSNLSLSFMRQGGVAPADPVIFRGGFGGVAGIRLSDYSFYWTRRFVRINATTVRATVQLVFVQTNLVDSPGVKVFFTGGTNSNNFIFSVPVVELGTTDFDPITGQNFDRYFRMWDSSGLVVGANVNSLQSPVLFQNADHPGLFRSQAHGWVGRGDSSFGSGVQPEVWDPNLILTTTAANTNGRYETNSVAYESSNTRFTILARDAGGATITDVAGATGLSDPTNSPGRVEIQADQLNLGFSRMRAENLISIRATNFADLTGFSANAQNVNLELLATNGSVMISNSFPAAVNRLHGTISAWSGVWQVDQFITNQIPVTDPLEQIGNWLASSNTVQYTYHVLVLDNQTSTNQPVGFENFRVASSNLVLNDSVTINKSFYFGGERFHLATNGSISVGGTNSDITAANLPVLNYFTNQGSIFAPETANFGYFDRPNPYSNIVNTGTIFASRQLFRAHDFINTGALLAFNGPILIDAGTNRLEGGFVSASGNIQLSGDNVAASNVVLSAGGALVFDIAQRLSDGNNTNEWSVGGGFSLLSKPEKGDLLATTITSTAPVGLDVQHVWGAEDRGDNPSGYLNNVALGRLVLDGAANSKFVFSGSGSQNGLYVDTLELRNNATNYAAALQVYPNMTIYFAHANVPGDKLTNVFGGRFVWVSTTTRAGPRVTVRSSMARTQTMTTQEYQALLASSPDVDGDGIPNELDETPFSGFTISRFIIIDVPAANGQPARRFAQVFWQGLAGSSYTVEYRDGVDSSTWSVLGVLNVVATGEQNAVQEIPPGGQRFYRVRYGH